MACKDCEERRKRLRDAIMHGKMADALDITVEGLRVMIGVDAGADHRKPSDIEVVSSEGFDTTGLDWQPVADQPDAKKPVKGR